MPLTIDPQEDIGYNLANQGLYELGVTEALWSLTDPGDLAVDAGANIGYMTSILAKRCGKQGRVLSFEPQPLVFASLRENAERWKGDGSNGAILLHEAALGDMDGKAPLRCGDWFKKNRGTAWIESSDSPSKEGFSLEVESRKLDSLIQAGDSIGILKMDVQGAELSVLRGMTKLVDAKAVRDIVFEEVDKFPAPTHVWLESKGYSIFAIVETLGGVQLLPCSILPESSWKSELPNYLATISPDRAIQRLNGRFWRAFGPLQYLS